MSNVFLLVIIFSFFSYGSNAQIQMDSITKQFVKGLFQEPKSLSIGDTVPDLKWRMYPFKDSILNLNALRGKVVLLEFWSFGCSSCIEFTPELQQLEEKFKNDIVVIPITFQSFDVTGKGYERYEKKACIKLHKYSAIEDTVSFAHFSAYQNPMFIWIGRDGKLLARTRQQYVCSENIQAAIDGDKLNFPDYRLSSLTPVRKDQPLPSTIYGSIITEERFGDFERLSYLSAAPGKKFIFETGPLLLLYAEAFKHIDSAIVAEMQKYASFGTSPTKLIKADVNFPPELWKTGKLPNTRELARNKDEWNKFSTCYVYESILPGFVSEREAYQRMIDDLNKNFNLQVSPQECIVSVLLLKKMKGFKAIPPLSRADYYIEESFAYNARMKTKNHMQDYVDGINETPNDIPIIIDSTDYHERLEFPFDVRKVTSLEELRLKLKAYKLELIQSEKKLYQLVVSRGAIN